MKANPLDLKIFPDQFIKIAIARENVSPDRARRNGLDLQGATELVENVQREKRDLAFVVLLVIKITVPSQPAPGDALDFGHLNHGKLIRFLAVMADKIVAGRNVKMTNLHRSDDIIEIGLMKADGIGPGQIIRRRSDGSLEYQHDELTIEEPLEIRIGEETVATTMRTPGHDEELVAGFLLSEAIVRNSRELKKFSRPTAARNRQNIIIVEQDPSSRSSASGRGSGKTPGGRDRKSPRRFGTISSSCGLCGKESIDAIRQNFPAVKASDFRIGIATLLALPHKLRANQSDFARTGGIHAAGIFGANGNALIVREDIGRHNAVDKAIGRAFLDGKLPLYRHLLLVSGRASFEIMQKALAAGIPIVASVSAPSSLAMEFAREMNQTLVGFLRPPSFNIYAHVERVILDQSQDNR